MFQRCLMGVLLLVFSAGAFADPLLILLLRLMRDQAISASIEAGVGALRQDQAAPAPPFGYALPVPPVPRGAEESRLRTVIDESFLHLTPAQRDAVFAGMRNILSDPRHAQIRSQIVAEFILRAHAVREGYRSLERLSYSEKRTLAARAKEEFTRLPAEQRRQLLEVLQSGMLPVPRDLNAIMLTEFGGAPLAAGGQPD